MYTITQRDFQLRTLSPSGFLAWYKFLTIQDPKDELGGSGTFDLIRFHAIPGDYAVFVAVQPSVGRGKKYIGFSSDFEKAIQGRGATINELLLAISHRSFAQVPGLSFPVYEVLD